MKLLVGELKRETERVGTVYRKSLTNSLALKHFDEITFDELQHEVYLSASNNAILYNACTVNQIKYRGAYCCSLKINLISFSLTI